MFPQRKWLVWEANERDANSQAKRDAIINYMHDTTSSYSLSQAQQRRLQDAGVSQRIIHDMIDSGK